MKTNTMKTFSISDIPEFSQKERIVVVGVIGKTPYRYPNKTTPLISSAQSEKVSFYLLGYHFPIPLY